MSRQLGAYFNPASPAHDIQFPKVGSIPGYRQVTKNTGILLLGKQVQIAEMMTIMRGSINWTGQGSLHSP